MSSVIEIPVHQRSVLAPLFKDNKHDVVLINSVLEGYSGTSLADSGSSPAVARLNSGSFTMLGGNAKSSAVRALLRHAPIYYVTPENDEWRQVLEGEFGDRIASLSFTEFSSCNIDPNRLDELVQALPSGFELRQIDKALAERLQVDLSNRYFLENFNSIGDFLGRGIGYCVVHESKVVSAATSMAMCFGAIDIEIETAPGYRGRGLGTAVGSKLSSHCLTNQIEPRWIASNVESENLALRLGYERGETYLTFEIQY